MFDIQVYGAGGESPDQAEQEAIRKFEVRVNNLLHTGTNRARVIAWLMNAEGAQGLPYGYLTKAA